MPNFQDGYLQQGTALGNLPQNVGLNADNIVINVGRNGYLRLTSDNTTATNRTFSLASGALQGQQLTIALVPAGAVTTGRAELLSTGNVLLSNGSWQPAVNDMIVLFWDMVNGVWREQVRSGSGSILIASTYTPTFTAGTNVASATAGLAHYMRVGNQVTVSGTGSIASTAATNTASAFTVTLPIASDLAAAGDLTGSGTLSSATSVVYSGVLIVAETTANTATFSYNAAQTAAGTLGYTFKYTVI